MIGETDMTTNGNGHKFNPNDHLMQVSQKDYLPVAWRLVWYRQDCPQGTISTELISLDLDRETEEMVVVWNDQTKRKEKVLRKANGYCLFKATVTTGNGASATA